MKQFPIGTQVRIKYDDRFDGVDIPAGAIGTVIETPIVDVAFIPVPIMKVQFPGVVVCLSDVDVTEA